MITDGQVMDISREAVYTIILTSAPLLLTSLIVGLIISIFQTVTSKIGRASCRERVWSRV